MRGDEDLESHASTGVDGGDLRRVAGLFPTGVAVITTTLDDEPYGFAANAFTSLSLDPPLVLVCAARGSGTRPALVASGRFTVNLLAADQEEVCRAFATRGADRFAGVSWEPGHGGAPRIHGAIAHLDCNLHSLLPGGDHVIFTGLVTSVDENGEDPLVFFRGAFRKL
jgi:3-hydroxy-9,10-secoandrosta-1,3,5(10)-triene-9,17-dione monooxygenase reductase component